MEMITFWPIIRAGVRVLDLSQIGSNSLTEIGFLIPTPKMIMLHLTVYGMCIPFLQVETL